MAREHKPSSRQWRWARVLILSVLLLLLLPDIAWVVTANGKYLQFTRPYAFMSSLLPSAVMLVFFFAICGRALWIPLVFALPFMFFVPLETAYIVQYGEPSWYAIIATTLESNSREIFDYLGFRLWVLAGLSILSVSIGICALALQFRTRYQLPKGIQIRSLFICFTIGAIGGITQLFGPKKLEIGQENVQANSTASSDAPQGLFSLWNDGLESSFPVGLPMRFHHYHEESDDIRTAAVRHADFRFHAVQDHPPSKRQLYVLIIGEASRADRWQLYGYGRETNPKLSKLHNVIRFPDMLTPWSASRMSVPIIVSRKKGDDTRSYFDEPSIAKVFAEAGFSTYWMSNQIAFGEYDSPISIVAHDASNVSFYNIADYSNPGNFDDVLLKPLQKIIDSDTDKAFVILHTLGSHQNYAYRYPESFDRFQPSLSKDYPANINDVELAEQIGNSYDDSILFTDHVIAEVIHELEGFDGIASAWYVSDHGEDLITPYCKLTGHGSGTVYNFRIPSIFWYSDSYAREFPSRLDRLKTHSADRITTENIFESLVDMADIEFPTHDATWSIFSDTWVRHSRIVTPLYGQARLDFDHAEESQSCHMMMPHH